MLLKNKTLKVLGLSDYCIGEEGAQKLIDSLSHNTTVESLVLDKGFRSSSIASSVVDNRVIFTNFVHRSQMLKCNFHEITDITSTVTICT